jgi:excisionase family DNA binding protein
MHDRWLSKREAAGLAGVSEKTIDRAIKRGFLRRAKNGVRRVLIAYSELCRWMNGGKVQRV